MVAFPTHNGFDGASNAGCIFCVEVRGDTIVWGYLDLHFVALNAVLWVTTDQFHPPPAVAPFAAKLEFGQRILPIF